MSNNEKLIRDEVYETLDGYALETSIYDLLDASHGPSELRERIKTLVYMLHLELTKVKARSIDLKDSTIFTDETGVAIESLLESLLDGEPEIQMEILATTINSVISSYEIVEHHLEDTINEDKDFDLSNWK